MKINYRHLILVLCGILLFMIAANFMKIDSRIANLAAAVIIVLLVLRTDFISGFFMAVLFSFVFYSLHPGENMPAFFLNTGIFTALAFLTDKLTPVRKNEKAVIAADESEKEFIRRVTSTLMFAHEMMCEIKKGMPRDALLNLMAKNIFSLLNVKQVMVYTAADGEKHNLLFSEGAFDRSAVADPAMFGDDPGLFVKNISAGVFSLLSGVKSGYYLLIPAGDKEAKKDAMILYREKEFEHSEIYIVEFFVAQVYAVIDKNRMISGMKDNYEKVIDALSLAIDTKDHDTAWHSLDTMHYAVKMAERLGLTDEEKENIKYASLLHDIGKIGISNSILNKPGALNSEEYEIIKMHPESGADILKKMDIFSEIMPIIMHHHEHVDGRGYPKSLKGDQIPLGARICAIADAYSVMMTNRPYRSAMSKEQTINELKRCAGTQFDEKLVGIFLEIVNSGETEPGSRLNGSGN